MGPTNYYHPEYVPLNPRPLILESPICLYSTIASLWFDSSQSDHS